MSSSVNAKGGKAAVSKSAAPSTSLPNKPAPNKPAPKSAEDESRGGVIRWIVGWLITPGLFVLALFAAGVLFGVHFHDAWFTRQVVRVGDFVARLF